MPPDIQDLEKNGLHVIDAREAFSTRPCRVHSTNDRLKAMNRIAQAFSGSSEQILQELVEAAITLCGAESAGISIERENGTDEQFYHWVATAGVYSGFTDAILPRYPSACTVSLQRGKPQLFTVGKPFFDFLGITAPLVTDGILLPWSTNKTRGTIFVMSHGPEPVFDGEDLDTMELLANLASMAIRQIELHRAELEQERLRATAELAHGLAHQINNPLQSLTNILYLVGEGQKNEAGQAVTRNAQRELERITSLVRKLLVPKSN